ncbi:UDP-3-O-(3-hydroxymyristoyl)glucosamine N-acyltransferase [Chloroflexota bacterium]
MTKEIGIADLASKAGGMIKGSFNKAAMIIGTCPIDHYTAGKVSFVKNRKYSQLLEGLENAVVLLPKAMADICDKYPQNIYILVENAARALIDIQNFFYSSAPAINGTGISKTAQIDASAKIDDHVYIGGNVCIGKNVKIGSGTKILNNSCILDNSVIGQNTYIYPNVCIYLNSEIGNNCIIHSGTQIGVDGFRFEQDIEHKKVIKIHHVGKVIIGNRVEIGANCTIDRATFENSATTLANDVKLDDQVHIGHNAEVQERTLIAAQTCLSGSVKIGQDAWIGAGVTISNGVRVGDRAKVLLNAVVAYNVAEDQIVSGFYAMPHDKWKSAWKRLKKDR